MAVDVARTSPPRRRGKATSLSRRDGVVVGLMIGVPIAFVVGLVSLPTFVSIALGFTSWDGIDVLDTINYVGGRNYRQIATIWLAVLLFAAAPIGLFYVYLLDKDIRGSRFYQSAFYHLVVLSLAVVGFTWQFIYSPDQGLINNLVAAAALLIMLPTVIVFILLQKQFVGGLTLGATKG